MNKRGVVEAEKHPVTAKDDGIHVRLDARGLSCPEPVLKTRAIMRGLRPGERVEVLADDPIAPIDFAAFSHRSGHPLRESSRHGTTFRFVIEHK